MVERSAVNRLAVGSNPIWVDLIHSELKRFALTVKSRDNPFGSLCLCFCCSLSYRIKFCSAIFENHRSLVYLQARKRDRHVRPFKCGVLSVDASPDGALATGSSDRTVMLWDLKTREAVQTMIKHSDQVCWGVVAFRPHDGAGVEAGRHASVSDDKSISLYDYI